MYMAKIFLSVGHSLFKNGSYTSANGIVNEYKYCKELAGYVKEYLELAGHTVTLCICPEKQFTKSSEEKTYKLDLENKGSYDLAAELHLNAYNGSACGTEVYYKTTKGKPYAEKVVAKLATVFKNRGAKKKDNLYFLNGTKAPAILIESFFCDNASDCEKGNDKKKIAKLIAEGIHGSEIVNTSDKLYRVQVGAYSVKANAEKMAAKLKAKGYSAIIV